MNWLLLIVIVVIAGLAYRGYRKGFIRMVLSVAVILLSVVITGILAPVISKSLCESEIVLNYVSEGVNEGLGIEESMNQLTRQAAGNIRSGQKSVELGESEQKNIIEKLALPRILTDSIANSTADMIENTGRATAQHISKYVCDSLARIIIRTLTYIVVFFIARIILRILVTVFKVVDNIPGMEDVSELVGGAIGAVTGLLVVWIGFLLLVTFSSTSFGQECYQCINDSMVLRFLYNNNLILQWILHSLS